MDIKKIIVHAHGHLTEGHKICPECDTPFKCTNDEKCWCNDVSTKRIEKKSDCICAECLTKKDNV